MEAGVSQQRRCIRRAFVGTADENDWPLLDTLISVRRSGSVPTGRFERVRDMTEGTGELIRPAHVDQATLPSLQRCRQLLNLGPLGSRRHAGGE